MVCSDSGECIAFGKEIKKIKEHFDGFTSFNFVTNCLRITQPSSNGLVDIITYERDGYEANAILKCARNGHSCDGSTLYQTHSPCKDCSKLILQSGIKRLVYVEDYKDLSGLDFLKNSGIEIVKY